MTKEAMERALEALEKLNNTNSHWWQEVDEDVVVQLSDAESALREALTSVPDWASEAIEQPAPVQQDPVAFDVTLEGQEAQALHDLLGDDRDNLSPLRLVVGDGHSGYGLYIALAEYQDEGTELIASIAPPAQQRHISYVCPQCYWSLDEQPAKQQEPVKLWLWKNFVNGRPEYWAFDNAFPVNLNNDDPQVIGEPCGYAWLKPSRQGRFDVSDEEVLRAVQNAKESPPAQKECEKCSHKNA